MYCMCPVPGAHRVNCSWYQLNQKMMSGAPLGPWDTGLGSSSTSFSGGLGTSLSGGLGSSYSGGLGSSYSGGFGTSFGGGLDSPPSFGGGLGSSSFSRGLGSTSFSKGIGSSKFGKGSSLGLGSGSSLLGGNDLLGRPRGRTRRDSLSLLDTSYGITPTARTRRSSILDNPYGSSNLTRTRGSLDTSMPSSSYLDPISSTSTSRSKLPSRSEEVVQRHHGNKERVRTWHSSVGSPTLDPNEPSALDARFTSVDDSPPLLTPSPPTPPAKSKHLIGQKPKTLEDIKRDIALAEQKLAQTKADDERTRRSVAAGTFGRRGLDTPLKPSSSSKYSDPYSLSALPTDPFAWRPSGQSSKYDLNPSMSTPRRNRLGLLSDLKPKSSESLLAGDDSSTSRTERSKGKVRSGDGRPSTSSWDDATGQFWDDMPPVASSSKPKTSTSKSSGLALDKEKYRVKDPPLYPSCEQCGQDVAYSKNLYNLRSKQVCLNCFEQEHFPLTKRNEAGDVVTRPVPPSLPNTFVQSLDKKTKTVTMLDGTKKEIPLDPRERRRLIRDQRATELGRTSPTDDPNYRNPQGTRAIPIPGVRPAYEPRPDFYSTLARVPPVPDTAADYYSSDRIKRDLDAITKKLKKM